MAIASISGGAPVERATSDDTERDTGGASSWNATASI